MEEEAGGPPPPAEEPENEPNLKLIRGSWASGGGEGGGRMIGWEEAEEEDRLLDSPQGLPRMSVVQDSLSLSWMSWMSLRGKKEAKEAYC